MKLLNSIILAIIITISVHAGGLWDMIKNSSSDGTIKTKQYTLEVAGVDTRAYIFNVPEMKSICIVTYSSHGIPAISCKTYKEMK